MRSIGTSIAEKDFEELLSAVWAAQVVQCARPIRANCKPIQIHKNDRERRRPQMNRRLNEGKVGRIAKRILDLAGLACLALVCAGADHAQSKPAQTDPPRRAPSRRRSQLHR